MATGSAKNRNDSRREVPWRFLLVAMVLIGGVAWYFWPRTSLPQAASKYMLESVIRQDYDWIYDHAFPEEKQIKGFDRALIQNYCVDHLSELFNAEQIGGYETFLEEPARGMSTAKLRLTNGKQIEMAALGFAEDGEMKVGAMEALFSLHRRIDTALGREPKGWAAMRAWFNAHGVDQVYMAQTGEMFELVNAKVHDPARTK